MKRLFAVAAICLSLVAVEAHSRDTKVMLAFETVLENDAYKEHVDPDVKLYFGKQRHPRVKTVLAEKVVTNKKTNAFNKSDEHACQWVFLSAIKQIQTKAKRLGGDAIINIESYYKKQANPSDSRFECHAGAFVAGVALRGDIVKLK